MAEQPSPRVTKLAWGRVEVEGRDAAFRDAKLYPGGARAWDWRETGTHHEPGVQPADVAELIEEGARVVVLSTGQRERLRVMPETLGALEAAGVEAVVLESRAAVARYNALAEAGEAVGALVHSTC